MDNVPVFSSVADRWRSLAKEQKISVGILCVCGIVALVLSVKRIHAGIFDPFTVSKSTFEESRRTVESIDSVRLKEEESRRRDTDGDGISDYDEEKLFQTSPYLRDTDGDGSPDNVELANGENPNCMAGQRCAAIELDVSALATSTGFLSPALLGGSDELYAAFQRGVNTQKQNVVNETGSTSTLLEPTLVRDAAVIRQTLLESGKVDAEVLKKITDAQLLELYDQATVEAARKQAEEGTGITDPSKYPTPEITE